MYQPPHRRGDRAPAGSAPRAPNAAGSSATGSTRSAPTPRGQAPSVPSSASAPLSALGSSIPTRFAGRDASSSLPAARQQHALPSARQPPLPDTKLQARRDLSLPTGAGAGTASAPPPRPAPHRFTSSPASAAAASDARSPQMRFARPRRYSPAPSEMEMLASVARSGGDGAEGDALKDFGTQWRFRAYIDEKIHQYHHTEDEGALQNIVRLFRKLREGIVASGRLDSFAIEAFESSVRYAVLARDGPQLLSALSGLVPDLYLAVDTAAAERRANGEPEPLTDAIERMDKLRIDCEAGNCPSGAKHRMGHTPYEPSSSKANHGQGPHSPHAAAGDDAPDNRSHFASLLLIYHVVHSPLNVFWDTYQRLVLPSARRLKQRDYKAMLSSVDNDRGESSGDYPLGPITEISPPAALSTPFTDARQLTYARTAARVLSPASFDPFKFAGMVTDEAIHPVGPHDHPDALERALLAWASPRVREMAGDRLRKAYMSAGVPFVARTLNLNFHGSVEGSVMLWAMANGASVKDGIVKLR